MKNLGQMMKQAQEMQNKLAEMQEGLANVEVTGSSGGGMVQVTLTGKSEARKISIDPSLMGADDKEVLEDLLVAAINDAKSKADNMAAEKMKELTGGLQLPPGMQFPFS
ncbi:MAG: YbaB/EbfC family nucleoid-associated protein [Rhodospirillales bacterium]